MNTYSTKFKGLKIIKIKKFSDLRGNVIKVFNKKKKYSKFNCFESYISFSRKGTIRGLHGQKGLHSQEKLIYCLKGKAIDLAVDMRANSKTYGQIFKKTINSKNSKAIFIPKGFAHGFLTLSDSAIVNYKVDNYYSKDCESGILFNDPNINIKWNVNESSLCISEKDLKLPLLKNIRN